MHKRIRRSGEPTPACPVLVSPPADCTLGSTSMVENQDREPMFRLSNLRVLRYHYGPPPHLHTHPAVSTHEFQVVPFLPEAAHAAGNIARFVCARTGAGWATRRPGRPAPDPLAATFDEGSKETLTHSLSRLISQTVAGPVMERIHLPWHRDIADGGEPDTRYCQSGIAEGANGSNA
jgi:hypothetical protein